MPCKYAPYAYAANKTLGLVLRTTNYMRWHCKYAPYPYAANMHIYIYTHTHIHIVRSLRLRCKNAYTQARTENTFYREHILFGTRRLAPTNFQALHKTSRARLKKEERGLKKEERGS